MKINRSINHQYSTKMITTLDNVKLKRGQHAWEVGVTVDGEYRPTRGTIQTGSNDITNPNKCWSNWELCKEECDRLNKR